MPSVEDVVGDYSRLMGVKAVWGRSSEAVMCFGAREDRYSTVRGVARRSINSPYLIAIGGGAEVKDALRGRVLEVVKLTGAYGETSAFVQDDDVLAGLAQWPVAIMASEVYSVVGEPHLVSDLGLEDSRILSNAFDGVKLDPIRMPALWAGIKSSICKLRSELSPPSDFSDPGKVVACGSAYPKRKISPEEGRKILSEVIVLERDPALSRAVKLANKDKNDGLMVCEGCDLRAEKLSLFDSHHLDPICSGPRRSQLESFAVLCPTCHRWAHVFGNSKFQPLPIAALRTARKTN